MLRRTPEQQAVDFMRANDKSPVVSGRAIQRDPRLPGKGGVYRLANGSEYRLGLAACQMLPEGYPRWLIL